MTPPSTPALDKLRSATFEVDPGLHAQYGNLRNQIDKGAHSPLGAAYSPQVVEQQRKAAMERLGQDEAQAYRSGQYDVNKLGYARDVAVAGMSQPQLVQTGTSGTQSGTESGTIKQTDPMGTIGQVASIGASVAPLSL